MKSFSISHNRLLTLLLISAVLLASCNLLAAPQEEPVEQPSESTPTETPLLEDSPTVPLLAPTSTCGEDFCQAPTAGELRLPDKALLELATLLNTLPEKVQFESLAEQDFPDSCLGLALPDEMCAQVITPGYAGVALVEGQPYAFRASLDGGEVRLENSLPPRFLEAGFSWKLDNKDGCRIAEFYADSAGFGMCEGQWSEASYVVPRRAAQYADFVKQYSGCFDQPTPAGNVTFLGQGSTAPDETQLRMLAEWALQVYQEQSSGQSDENQRLVLTWNRSGGIAGFCDELRIYRSGEAVLSDCRKGQPDAPVKTQWLSADEMKQVYAWMAGWKSFEWEQSGPGTADALTTRLTFAGSGKGKAGLTDQQAVADLAARVFERLNAE
jgi:hypothetical protein